MDSKIIFLLFFVLTGCATKPLSQIDPMQGLPQEIPSEFQEKFEVKDVVELNSQPQPARQNEVTNSDFTSDPLATALKVRKKSQKDLHDMNPKKTKGKEISKSEDMQAVLTALAPSRGGPAPAVAESSSHGDEAVVAGGAATMIYPNHRPEKDPVWIGEKLVYEITYFGIAAGEFTVTVLPFKEVNHRKVYHVKGNAVSSKLFSLFYRLNDWVETFIDYDGFFPHRFHLVLDEKIQTRDSLELYDTEKKRTFFWNRWNHNTRGYTEVKDFFPMEPFSQDTFSSMYFLRTIPLPEDSVQTFPVISEGKNWEAVVKVVRREMMDSPMGRVQAVVLLPDTKYQGVLKKQGDSFIWLTDDDRRILLRLEAKVRIGTVVANLKRYEPGTPP